jgi:hypothetical protein
MRPTAATLQLSRPGLSTDRRRHQRVAVALLGRYMLSDRQEYPCQTVDMSPGGVLLTCAVRGQLGERIVAYLEHIGRIEGEVRRVTPTGLAAQLTATVRKRDKLAAQLTWLANREMLGLPEDRRHERVVPRQGGATMRLESGREIAVRIIDVSLSGAGIATEHALPLGVGVVIGRTPATVVRHFAGGLALEFRLPLSPDRLDEGIVL